MSNHSRVVDVQPLSDTNRMALQQLLISEGYRVLLDVMERLCRVKDEEWIAMDGSNPAEILAGHAESRGFWRLFADTQAKVFFEVGEFQAERKKIQQPEPVPLLGTDETVPSGF
jgi:hypothetical protein